MHDDGRASTRLRWSSAGHLPPLLATPSGQVTVLTAGKNGPLLGLGAGVVRPEHELVLERGSVLLLYTDGLVERRGEHLRHGIARLQRVLAEAVATVPLTSDPGDLERVVDDVLARMLDGHVEDDVAVVAVHLRPEDGTAPSSS
jgi:serine phosphatase RsbU (regulator of sigma subunit)